jgi:hypothetical protein
MYNMYKASVSPGFVKQIMPYGIPSLIFPGFYFPVGQDCSLRHVVITGSGADSAFCLTVFLGDKAAAA